MPHGGLSLFTLTLALLIETSDFNEWKIVVNYFHQSASKVLVNSHNIFFYESPIYEWDIFDQWPKLHLGFDVEPEIWFLKVIYYLCINVWKHRCMDGKLLILFQKEFQPIVRVVHIKIQIWPDEIWV